MVREQKLSQDHLSEPLVIVAQPTAHIGCWIARPPTQDEEQAAQRAWGNLQAVYGYGPHGLCDICGQPLETLGSLRTGRCSLCVLIHGESDGLSVEYDWYDFA